MTQKELLKEKLMEYCIAAAANKRLAEETHKKLYPEQYRKKYTAEEELEMRYFLILEERKRLTAMLEELDKEKELPL